MFNPRDKLLAPINKKTLILDNELWGEASMENGSPQKMCFKCMTVGWLLISEYNS